MPVTLEILEEKRRLFNEFAKSVLPDEVLNTDSLSFVDLAKRVEPLQNQRIFCERAIAMLEANMEHYRPNAEKLPKPRRNNIFSVASTLIVSGIVYYKTGVSVALVAAGLWYWFAAQSATRRLNEQITEAEQHNSETDEWLETLKTWEMACDELSSLQLKIA